MTREFARHGGGEYGGTALDDIIFEVDGRDLLGIVLVLAFLFVPVGFSFMPYKGDPAKPPNVCSAGWGLATLTLAYFLWQSPFGL